MLTRLGSFVVLGLLFFFFLDIDHRTTELKRTFSSPAVDLLLDPVSTVCVVLGFTWCSDSELN